MEYFLTLFYLLQSFDLDIKIDGDAVLEIFGKVSDYFFYFGWFSKNFKENSI